jgi:hypothetical protein
MFNGDFDLNEISILTDKMKIPGRGTSKNEQKTKIMRETWYGARYYIAFA